MSESREIGQERTVRKSDIAYAILELAEEKNKGLPQNRQRHISYGYLSGQMNLAARELTKKFPGVYGGLSEKIEHNEAETAAILSQIHESTEENDIRAKYLKWALVDKELLQEIFTKLFPQTPKE